MDDFYDEPTHAIVIGGSISGLMTARVLADFFDTVTIIERDRLPRGPELRNGTPQARHAHTLLAHGQELMENLFPGIVDDLTAQGAPDLHWGLNGAYMNAGGWSRYQDMQITTKLASRALLEWTMRCRLLAEYPVQILASTQVNGLIASEGKQQVTGLLIQSRKGQREEREIYADFVVDASGRGSRSPEWLEALGFARPEETTVDSHLAYATRWYELPADPPPWNVLYINACPPDIPRAGAIFQTEGNRWMVMLAGTKDNHPPTDPEGFLEFSKSIATPELYNAIKDAKPISNVYGYQRTSSRIRHYERLERMPARFVVLGDAAVAFNPIHGQGMTAAAMEVIAFKTWLNEKGIDAPSVDFQKRLFNEIRTAWTMSTSEDLLHYPTTEGERPGLMMRFVLRYFDLVTKIAPSDPEVSRAVVEIAHLTASPTVLMQPKMIWKVVRGLFTEEREADSSMPEQWRWYRSHALLQKLITAEWRITA